MDVCTLFRSPYLFSFSFSTAVTIFLFIVLSMICLFMFLFPLSIFLSLYFYALFCFFLSLSTITLRAMYSYKAHIYASNIILAFHKAEQMETYTTTEYNYDQVWLDVSEQHDLKFLVRVCKDANVGLFTSFEDSESKMYRIIIGGWGNRASAIRGTPVPGATNLVQETTPAILSCESLRPFWISWEGGLIRMGRGSTVGVDTLMQWQDQDTPLTVTGASLASGSGTGISADWEVYRTYIL